MCERRYDLYEYFSSLSLNSLHSFSLQLFKLQANIPCCSNCCISVPSSQLLKMHVRLGLSSLCLIVVRFCLFWAAACLLWCIVLFWLLCCAFILNGQALYSSFGCNFERPWDELPVLGFISWFWWRNCIPSCIAFLYWLLLVIILSARVRCLFWTLMCLHPKLHRLFLLAISNVHLEIMSHPFSGRLGLSVFDLLI